MNKFQPEDKVRIRCGRFAFQTATVKNFDEASNAVLVQFPNDSITYAFAESEIQKCS